MTSPSYIELSREALAGNLQFMRSLFDKKVRISSVVKGNAYGHGISSFVPLAESLGIDHFSVYSCDEAKMVFDAKQSASTEVMIMGHLDDEDLPWLIENDLSFFVFGLERLHATIACSRQLKKKARIHIELETGMNRTGFTTDFMDQLVTELHEANDCLIFEGLCTHFAGAESIANHIRVEQQKAAYKEMASQLESQSLVPKIKHTCCSAASIRLPDMQYDMVRIGILQYGFWPSIEIYIEYMLKHSPVKDPLRRVISWKSQVMNIKQVQMGSFIGYGTTYLAQRDMRIAILPVGYALGFSRSLSNQGRALIRGMRVPVIGIVNMNSLAIDITDVEEVNHGDIVTLIGRDTDVEISVSSFSELSDQLNYELLTRLPAHIPRIVS
jgi:alanine racemase